jgi:hypothetical protein
VAGNGFQQQSRSSNNNENFNGNNRRRRYPATSRHSQRQQDYYDNQWIEEEDDDVWLESIPSTMRRRVTRNYGQNAGYYGPRVMRKFIQENKIFFCLFF